MKTLLLYAFVCAWCACWFCGCGGSTELAIANSNEQSQGQNQTGEGDVQTAQEACAYCVETQEPGTGSLSQCVTQLGFDISDC